MEKLYFCKKKYNCEKRGNLKLCTNSDSSIAFISNHSTCLLRSLDKDFKEKYTVIYSKGDCDQMINEINKRCNRNENYLHNLLGE